MRGERYVSALAVKCVSVAALFGVQVLIARESADRAEYGFYSYLVSVLNLASFVVLWGLDKYLVREVSVHADAGRSSHAWGVIGAATRVILVNAVIAAAPLALFLDRVRPDRNDLALFAGVWLLLTVMSLARAGFGTLRGMQRVVASEASLNALRPVALGVAVLAWSAARGPLSADVLVWLTAGAFGASLLTTAVLSRRTLPARSPERDEGARRLHRRCLPYLMIGVGVPLLMNLDVILLGSLGTDDDVGLYAACARIINLATLGLISVNLLVAPRIPVLFQQGRIAEMQALLRRNNVVILGLTVAPVVVLLTAGGAVLALFGPGFAEGSGILRILLIGQVINVLAGPVNIICMMTNQQRAASALVFVACAMEAVLCYVLVPGRGAAGAAWANAAALGFLNVALAVVVIRRVRVNPTFTNTLRRREA